MITKGIFMANSKKEFPGRGRDPQEGDGRKGTGRHPLNMREEFKDIRNHEFVSQTGRTLLMSAGTAVEG